MAKILETARGASIYVGGSHVAEITGSFFNWGPDSIRFSKVALLGIDKLPKIADVVKWERVLEHTQETWCRCCILRVLRKYSEVGIQPTCYIIEGDFEYVWK